MPKVVKSVTFTLEDSSEKQMLEFLKEHNIRFSPLMKRLLWAYMSGATVTTSPKHGPDNPSSQVENKQNSEDIDLDAAADVDLPFD